MATSSIFHNVVVKNDKECERLINAFELSEKKKEEKSKHPQVFFISDLHLGHKIVLLLIIDHILLSKNKTKILLKNGIVEYLQMI